MKRLIAIFILLSLTACKTHNLARQSVTPPPINNALLNSAAFPIAAHYQIPSEQQIFALDAEMQRFVDNELMPISNQRKRTYALIKHIFESGSIGLAYQSGANLTAIESYHNAQANCLSLTILAYTLAEKANLSPLFQEVKVPEYWVRNGSFNMLTRHINLIVDMSKPKHRNNVEVVYGGHDNIQVDFDPFVAKKRFPTQIVSKHRVLAMFYNNIGAQAMVDEEFDKAYRYFYESINKDPSYSSAWGNLALLYKLTDQYSLAEQSYRYAIKLDSRNYTAQTNLALLLKLQGKTELAEKMLARIQRKRENNAYYHALLADEAAHQHNFVDAISSLKKAIKIAPNEHEFYYALAKAYYQLGKIKKSRIAIKKAISLNRFADVKAEYVAKLNFLKAQPTH